MRVKELMTRRVASCSADDQLSAAARAMYETDCGFVPVLDVDGVVIGTVTDRDVCLATYLGDAPPRAIQVRTAMGRPAVTCGPEDTVGSAVEAMRAHRLHRLPVVDATGRLIGVLSLDDVVREAIREHHRLCVLGVTFADVAETLAAASAPYAAEATTAREVPTPR
jgi:CBS domain-containing protein